MKISRLNSAMTDISDDLLSSAMERSPRKRIVWTKAAALAACFVFAVTAGVMGISRRQQIPSAPETLYVQYASDESQNDYSLTEADSRFDGLLPTDLPDGYTLSGMHSASDGKVLEVVYTSDSGAITLTVADKSRFDSAEREDGVYVEFDDLGAVYKYSQSGSKKGLLEAALSAECFTSREIVEEIPHSYDAALAGECDHKYFNTPHSGEPILHQFQHADMAGFVCTATFEEYWHDMVCCACGETFGGYYKACSETHSNFAGLYRDHGTCPFAAWGVCWTYEYESYKNFEQRFEDYLTYGYPLYWEDTVLELKHLIDIGIYELSDDGMVHQNGYYVIYDLYDDGSSFVARFYDTDENVFVHLYKSLEDEGRRFHYELRKDDVTPDMLERVVYTWGD